MIFFFIFFRNVTALNTVSFPDRTPAESGNSVFLSIAPVCAALKTQLPPLPGNFPGICPVSSAPESAAAPPYFFRRVVNAGKMR